MYRKGPLGRQPDRENQGPPATSPPRPGASAPAPRTARYIPRNVPQVSRRPPSARQAQRERLRQQAREFSRQYQIPEDVAFQIVRGDYTFKDWMERHQVAMDKRDKRQVIEHERKIQRARNEGMARQYFLKQKKNREPMVFVRADGTVLEGPVTGILPYHFYVGDGKEQQQYEKLSLLYCYKKEHEAELRPILLQHDSKVTALGLLPSRDRTNRFQVPEADMKACSEGKRRVTFVMQDGVVLSGTVDWFSKFNVKLRLAQDASVVVFAHAVHEFRKG